MFLEGDIRPLATPQLSLKDNTHFRPNTLWPRHFAPLVLQLWLGLGLELHCCIEFVLESPLLFYAAFKMKEDKYCCQWYCHIQKVSCYVSTKAHFCLFKDLLVQAPPLVDKPCCCFRNCTYTETERVCTHTQ